MTAHDTYPGAGHAMEALAPWPHRRFLSWGVACFRLLEGHYVTGGHRPAPSPGGQRALLHGETVRSVAMAYQENLRGHMTVTGEQQHCYVMERSSGPYQTNEVTKDGSNSVTLKEP